MSEFFFRDTIPEFWKLIYAEYRLLYLAHEREPFIFTAPNPNIQPLAQYLPKESDTIMFAFMGHDGREAISVDAEFQPDREWVQLMSFYHGARDTTADPLWKTLLSSLKKDPRWIDLAQPVGKPSKLALPQKPAPGSDVFAWLEYRLQMKTAGHPYTLEQIAKDIPLSHGRVRYWNVIFMRQQGLQSRIRNDTKNDTKTDNL